MVTLRTPRLPTVTTHALPSPPPDCPDHEAADVRRLCSRFPGLALCITVVVKTAAQILNIPSSTVQSYAEWSVTFQQRLICPESQDERETFLHLAGYGRIRRFSTVVNAYLFAQFTRIRCYSEDNYKQLGNDVKRLAQAAGQLQRSLDVMSETADSLSRSPGHWWKYADKIQYRVRKAQYQASKINLQTRGSRNERKDFLAGLSLFLLRSILLFAGAEFKTPQTKKTGFDPRAGRLFQSILGRVEIQDKQPILRWIYLAQKASAERLEFIRSVKALRNELDNRVVATPAWLRIKQHAKRFME